MSEPEYIERFRHHLIGLATDGALTARQGAEFALWMRMRMKQIDQLVAEMYRAARAGQAAPPAEAPKAGTLPMNGTKRTTA